MAPERSQCSRLTLFLQLLHLQGLWGGDGKDGVRAGGGFVGVAHAVLNRGASRNASIVFDQVNLGSLAGLQGSELGTWERRLLAVG